MKQFYETNSRRLSVSARLLLLSGMIGSSIALPKLQAADWPQWRGLMRNGISIEKFAPWKTPPRQAWQVNIGEGWSAVTVWGGRAYTMGNQSGQDILYCLDAASGRESWRYSYPCGAGDYGGPRATPVIDGGKVYTLSREGHALCVNATTGKLVWRKELQRETGAASPQWGFAGSPLVQGKLVIYNVGEAGTALDKTNGRVVWRSGRGQAGYATPVPFTAGAQSGVLLFSGNSLVAVDANSGRQFWRFPWDTQYGVNAADPLVIGDRVFISSNYGKGCALLNISGGQPQVVWQNRSMKNHFNASVRLGGHLFGNDENTLRCIDLATGAERWNNRGIGKGGLIGAAGKLIVLTERGELLAVSGASTAYGELARTQLPRGQYWTHPVLANGKIYCRSHEGTLVCLAL